MKKAFIFFQVFILFLASCRAIAPGAEKTQGVTASIQVFEDTDGDGKQSKGEMPIPGALVVAVTNVHGTFTQHAALTDEEGKASFDADYTHYFDIRAVTPCGYTRTTPETLSAAGKSSLSKYSFGFKPATGTSPKPASTSLRFQVWQDINRDGIRQENEPPLGGVRLDFTPALGTSPRPNQKHLVGFLDENELFAETNDMGEAVLEVGNACGAMQVAPIYDWGTTGFGPTGEHDENGAITFQYDAQSAVFEWGVSRYEAFHLTVGEAHHPEGMGQWVFFLNTTGGLTIRHNVYDESTKYGPYFLSDQETQELWTLISAANIESLPRTFERPGQPDETAYTFDLHTINDVYIVEMWVDDAKEIPELQALVDQLIYLLEAYTGQKY